MVLQKSRLTWPHEAANWHGIAVDVLSPDGMNVGNVTRWLLMAASRASRYSLSAELHVRAVTPLTSWRRSLRHGVIAGRTLAPIRTRRTSSLSQQRYSTWSSKSNGKGSHDVTIRANGYSAPARHTVSSPKFTQNNHPPPA